jgi:hypothetical protein
MRCPRDDEATIGPRARQSLRARTPTLRPAFAGRGGVFGDGAQVAAVPRRSRVRDDSKVIGRRGARRRVYGLNVGDKGARWRQSPRRPSHFLNVLEERLGERGTSPRCVEGAARGGGPCPFREHAPAAALPTPRRHAGAAPGSRWSRLATHGGWSSWEGATAGGAARQPRERLAQDELANGAKRRGRVSLRPQRETLGVGAVETAAGGAFGARWVHRGEKLRTARPTETRRRPGTRTRDGASRRSYGPRSDRDRARL